MKIPNIKDCILLNEQGYCNEIYTYTTKNIKYIIRKLLRKDIDRNLEFQIQTLAFEQNITAKPILYSKEENIMISVFLDGIHKNNLDIHNIKLLAISLKKLHNINYALDILDLKSILNKSEKTIHAFEIIDKYPSENVLCHNDLNPKNIIFNNDVKFIDWEYASVNDKYFDIASICIEFKLNKNEELIFLNTYFGSDLSNQDKLNAYKILYLELCTQWFNENIN